MSTENKNFDWKKLPSQIWMGILYILKLPNWIWSLPILNKAKGVRLYLVIWFAAVVNIGQAIDWPIVTDAICAIAKCNSQAAVAVINEILTALALALKIEDQQQKKAFFAKSK